MAERPPSLAQALQRAAAAAAGN